MYSIDNSDGERTAQCFRYAATLYNTPRIKRSCFPLSVAGNVLVPHLHKAKTSQ